jgi:fructokinase
LNNKAYDVVSLGECLIDCLVNESDDHQKLMIEGNPGGAPGNVLVAMSSLGMRTAFIGKVGDDVFGHFMDRTLKSHDVDTTGIIFSEKPTTLAMVSLDAVGNRSFRFYRERTADVELTWEEINKEIIDRCHIFHFGSVSMSTEPIRSATLSAASYAHKIGKKISFDPNLRPNLWSDINDARQPIIRGLELADYVKLSDEEQEFITGIADPVEGGKVLMEQYRLEFLAVTLGPKGLIVFNNGNYMSGQAYDVETVDTTGAGDAMWGATLTWLIKNADDPIKLSKDDMVKIVDYANAAGSCSTMKYGAINAMPNDREIMNCIAQVKKLVV